MSMYDRTEILLGKEAMEKIKKSNICIIGIGGVGSYALEGLVRVGVGNITVIDKDVVKESNINRQLVAYTSTLGMPKVAVAAKRVADISPNVKCVDIEDFVNVENVQKYITKDFDYVLDAVDDVEAKISIISRCKEVGVNVISCMGMAEKVDPTKIKIGDISKTEMCPLARIVRKKLKMLNIQDVQVVYSTEQSKKLHTKELGSVSYVPSVAGLIMASNVINSLSINQKG